jgi:hypothetical protein
MGAGRQGDQHRNFDQERRAGDRDHNRNKLICWLVSGRLVHRRNICQRAGFIGNGPNRVR